MFKHFITNGLHDALGYGYHQSVINIGRNNADNICQSHCSDNHKEQLHFRIFHPDKRSDVVIDQITHQIGTCYLTKGSKDQRNHYYRKMKGIAILYIGKKSQRRLAHIRFFSNISHPSSGLRRPLSLIHFRSVAHSSSPPFFCDSYTSL